MGTPGKARRREDAIDDTALVTIWSPNPGPQYFLLCCPIFECFYGGARGGGKTDGALADFAIHADRYGADASGVFFRRRAKNLEDVEKRAHQLYGPLGWKWNGGTHTWTSPKGATLRFRHLWSAADADDYLGHAYTWICFEELGQWPTPEAIDKMRGTLRSAVGVPCRMLATGNPGGAGHNWIKARYVSPAPRGYKPLYDDRTKTWRVYIPARLEHNLKIMSNDPGYEHRLFGAGDHKLIRAWRHGDWDIIAGGFFDDVWNEERHVLPANIVIPPTWRKRLSFDWGSAKPASLGLWAVSDGTPIAGVQRHIPRGSFVRFGEWYTAATDRTGSIVPNLGRRLANTDLGSGIAMRAKGHTFSDNVADPSIFIEEGGPSIYQQMRQGMLTAQAVSIGTAVTFAGADNSRVAGWTLTRQMLEQAGKERAESPGLWVTENCVDFIRTVPVLQRDEKNPDDVDTDSEDHIGDETRYAVMSGRRSATVQELRL